MARRRSACAIGLRQARTATRSRAPPSTPRCSAFAPGRDVTSSFRCIRATTALLPSVRTRVMIRSFRASLLTGAVLAALLSAACSGEHTSAAAAGEPAPVAVRTATVQIQPIDRFLRVTGSLLADEHAEVAAEIGGRVVGAPGERGTRVTAGAVLVRLSATESDASLREAQANAGQLEARLGLAA